MLPHIFPPYPERNEFDIFASMEPARQVGGDFYDFYFVDDDHLCLIIADVSGKGVPAALFMMTSKTILQSFAMSGISPAEIVTKTNDAIMTDNPTGMFVTVWVGILELSTGKLTCTNAGHEYPAIRRADGSYALYKDQHDLVIGWVEDYQYEEYTLWLHPGDRLFLYTDGVPEATDADNKMFGNERMLTALNREPDAEPQQVLLNVRESVREFVGDAEQFDDLTMLCIAYRGRQGQ
jgi:sigma-B regulation protein RsbU (phosphoserine phosphatase)